MARPQRPFGVLIVEDEALLALDLESMITDEGHKVIGEAMSLDEVRDIDLTVAPDLAFVDIQLADNSSGLDVCAYIKGHWPTTAVVFVTANPGMIPVDFAGAHGVILKPFSRVGLLSAMRFIEQGLSDPPPSLGLPLSFIASPGISSEWTPTGVRH